MYKKTMSIEARFKEIADENPEYRELWATWNLNKKILDPILNTIIKDYPHYSLHDSSHSESILLNIEKALGNENIEKLSPTDMWVLLHVSYLHDFGMVILDTKIHEFWGTKDFQLFLNEQLNSTDEDIKRAAMLILSEDKGKEKYDVLWPLEIKSAVTLLTSKYCRWQHGDFSRNYILDINEIWGIDIGHNGLVKKRLVSLVAEISAMHTKSFDCIYKLHKEANGFKGDFVHPRLIASLLRLGDALDLDNGRFNYFGEKIFGEMPRESKIHYGKHESTSHVLVNEALIEVEADCPNDSIYRETRRWYDSLKNEIDKMHLHWSDIATEEFNHPPKLASYKILRHGVEDSLELSNLKFTIDQGKAFEILEGASIYKDRFSCLREIIQNAEDASKIQLWRDIKSGMYYSEVGIDKAKVKNKTLLPSDIPEWIYKIYSINVTVEKNADNNAVVSITDHGTGISIDTLKGICNVGQSFHQKRDIKKEIEEMPIWLRPTATFGIGLQSCFMATDEITIFTNSSKDGSYKMIFRTGREEGYVNVETISSYPIRGSKVVLEFQNDMNFSYQVWGFTARHLQKIEPFETNCVVIYKIIESIFQECDNSFFPIKVTSESIKYTDEIESSVSKKGSLDGLKEQQGFLCSLAETNTLTCWYNNSLYTVTLSKIPHGTVKVKFKGKDVKKNKIPAFFYKGFSIEVDIYGKATKDALSLNREELSYKISAEIEEEIDEIISLYYDLIFEKSEELKSNTKLMDAVMLTAWCYKKTFPEELYEYVSKDKNISVLSFNSESAAYEENRCSLYDIVKEFPKIYYINRDIADNSFIEDHKLSKNDLIKELNGCQFAKEDYPLLIIDKQVKEFFSYAYHDVISIKSDKDISICIVRDKDELYNPDPYTRQKLIKSLVYREEQGGHAYSRNIMRRAIPAISDYSKLAVSLNKVYFIGGDSSSKWKIISPISLRDFEDMNGLSQDLFVETIVNKPAFENIVNHILANGRMKSSRDDIISEYRALIKEFYQLEKPDTCIKE